jgi:hypothetical protein
VRNTRRTAARFAATGAALTLTLGGLVACGDDDETVDPAPGTEQEGDLGDNGVGDNGVGDNGVGDNGVGDNGVGDDNGLENDNGLDN